MATALAIIQGGTNGHPFALPWYTTNPVEPIGGSQFVTIGSSVTVDPMTLDSIMDTIIANKPQNVIVVCHGHPGGLAIPLHKDSKLGLDMNKVVTLSGDREFVYDGIKTPVFADDKVAAGLSEANAKMLRGKMNTIRGLGLAHVGFRACDLGGGVMAFREFFGAKNVSAPKFGDMYGNAAVEIGGNLANWMEKKKKLNKLNRVWLDGDVAFSYLKVNATSFKLTVKAASDATLLAWKKKHLSASSTSDRAILFHGMESPYASRGEPAISFVLDGDFMLNMVIYPRP
ncbi:MAG: hypothetical protein ABL984_14990 [Pyrinomonadaceae bacterium]